MKNNLPSQQLKQVYKTREWNYHVEQIVTVDSHKCTILVVSLLEWHIS